MEEVLLLMEEPKIMWFLQMRQRLEPQGCVPRAVGSALERDGGFVLISKFPRLAVRLRAMRGLDGSISDMRLDA